MGNKNACFLESYKHKAAKNVLKSWLSNSSEVRTEQYFGQNTYTFKPDLTTFTEGFVDAFWEVVHTHEMDGRKLGKMQYYCYVTGQEILCHEVDAEWILRQTEKPERIEKFTYKLT